MVAGDGGSNPAPATQKEKGQPCCQSCPGTFWLRGPAAIYPHGLQGGGVNGGLFSLLLAREVWGASQVSAKTA